MFQLHFLRKENDLNKIIKAQKKERSKINILFISLWDDWCTDLVTKLKEKYAESDKGPPLYIVDSFYMPHSFVIYGTSKLPHLVQLSNRGIHSEDYLPTVINTLFPKKRKKVR